MPPRLQRCPSRLCCVLLLALARGVAAQSPEASDWGHAGGDPGGQYYSHLNQITRDNVAQLQIAWTYRAAEPLPGGSVPMLAFGTVYFATPSGVLIALDPATGRERWRFDRYKNAAVARQRARPVAVWQADDAGGSVGCNRRVFLPTPQSRLMVIDGITGRPCAGLGEGIPVPGEIASLVMHRGLVITLLSAGELRAFDALTGARRWSLPLANLIAGLDSGGQLSLDAALGLVFVPGASQLAVDTVTGKPAWQLAASSGEIAQPAPTPALVTLNTPGGPLPVLAQTTPRGELRLLRRENGRSIGRNSLMLLPQGYYAREDAWGLTVLDRGLCRRHIAELRRESSINPSNIAIDVDRGRMIVAVNDLPVRIAAPLGGAQTAGEEPLLSIFGLPCVRPPWGSLMNVDLQKRQIVWEIPLGVSRPLLPAFLPSRNFGTPNLGGPMVTAGGLIFIAAAADAYLRAFDVDTGKSLWRSSLPKAGNSTPISYRAGSDQRQYILITAGGDRGFGNPVGDQLIAFALPRAQQGR